MARKYITGDKALERRLVFLGDKAADRVARSAQGAKLTVINKAQKAAAPVGPTGNMKANVGKRNEKQKRTGIFEAKTGINVGKQSSKKRRGVKRAPHGHLVALGTKPRFRKALGGRFEYIRKPSREQLSTGTMPANPFIRTSTASALGAANAKAQTQATKALAREAKRARNLK